MRLHEDSEPCSLLRDPKGQAHHMFSNIPESTNLRIFFFKIFFAQFLQKYSIEINKINNANITLYHKRKRHTLQPSEKLNTKFCEKTRRFRIRERHVMNSLKDGRSVFVIYNNRSRGTSSLVKLTKSAASGAIVNWDFLVSAASMVS